MRAQVRASSRAKCTLYACTSAKSTAASARRAPSTPLAMLKASTIFVGGAAWTFGRINQEPKASAPCHLSVLPDAPEGWQRDQELKEALDAAQAAPEEGGSAAGHLPRPLRRGFFSAGKG